MGTLLCARALARPRFSNNKGEQAEFDHWAPKARRQRRRRRRRAEEVGRKKRGEEEWGGVSEGKAVLALSLSSLSHISSLSLFALLSLSPPSPRSSLSRSLPPQSRADLEGEPCFLSLARRLRGRRVPGRCSAAAPPPLWRRAAEEGAPTGGGQEQIDADLRLP